METCSTLKPVTFFDRRFQAIRSNFHGCFIACIFVILAISAYDSYLVVANQHIKTMEKNPICLALINLDPHNMSIFLAGKLIGNLGVISVLSVLKSLDYRHYMTVAISVAGFQIGLLFFLHFSDPSTGFLHFNDLFCEDREGFRRGLWNLASHYWIALIALALFGASRWHGQAWSRREIPEGI